VAGFEVITEALFSYVEGDDWPKLETSLREIVGTLQAASARPSAVANGESPAFASYERRRTVAQAWTTEREREDIVDRLSNLLRSADASQRKAEAKALIEPFQRLANQALWNFEQPSEPLPRGVLELCKAAP